MNTVYGIRSHITVIAVVMNLKKNKIPNEVENAFAFKGPLKKSLYTKMQKPLMRIRVSAFLSGGFSMWMIPSG
ncbi:hypothetical protein J22TS1_37370 [Siminovitchia terrae]|nr:hypothetical protein J22TS1_37370 [Siminovitchia terrae]